jgi:DNA-binding CsgD family transcriptional regulator
VYARSEGNALYAEEILAAGLDGRGTLPPTLRDALMLRVDRLSPDAQEVLRWISCQPTAAHSLVAAVAGLDPAPLRDALREAVASHIVVTVGDEGYGFRHALLREVVYDDLLPGERTEMHAALARALEERIEGGETGAHVKAQAAHHWTAAGDQPRALAAAVRAALAEVRVNAFGEAQALFERALALWERVPEPEQTAGIEQLELLKRAAFAADQAGDPARQEALLRRALELVGEDVDPAACALLRERLSQALWSLHRQDESVEELRLGLALLADDEDSRERAALLSELGKKRMLQARFDEAEQYSQEAIAVARATGDRAAEAKALNALGAALGGRGDAEEGVRLLRESLAIAHDLGLAMEEGGAWINIADILHLAGRTEEALQVVHDGIEAGLPESGRTVDWMWLGVSEFSFHLGDWDAAEAAIPPPSRRHTGGTFLLWQICRARLALGRGDIERAEDALAALDRALTSMTEPQFVGPHGVMRSELARRAGDLPKARAAVDDALDRIEFCSDDMARITLVAAGGLRVEGDAGQLARDIRDAEAESLARERADALLERARVAAASGGPVEEAELALAEAEYARATGENAADLWVTAAERWDALARPYPVAYARWREAEALMEDRDRDGAARAASAALGGARRLGSAWLAEEVVSLAARARLQLGDKDAAAAATPAAEEPENPFGLTARERDVLALVASGATNREIGEQLHMAEKTASVHVSRILAKLNVRSRTEAAAVAHRQGLVPAA